LPEQGLSFFLFGIYNYNQEKEIHMRETLKIITHNGVFHADEVLAAALIVYHTNPIDYQFIRTRDKQLLSEAKQDPNSYVLDVGGEFDCNMRNFDHHQPEFNLKSDKDIPLSSAGLVLDHLVEQDYISKQEAGFLRSQLIDSVDAIDTGFAVPLGANIQWPIFSNLISAFNHSRDVYSDMQSIAFEAAVDLACSILNALETRYSYLQEVKQELTLALSEQAGLQVVTIPAICAGSWQNQLLKHPHHENAKFVVFESGGSYRVMQIPVEPGSFEGRLSLPESWRGLNDEELDSVTGIPGGIFVHKAGFIGGWKTQEAAYAAATKAIRMQT